MKTICSDLDAQYQELDDLVSTLSEKKWHMDTPFDQWTIFDTYIIQKISSVNLKKSQQ